jgi:Polyketide cyclase / dehydrase and lipid transport
VKSVGNSTRCRWRALCLAATSVDDVERYEDGLTANERLTEYAASHSFAYELTEFSNVLRRLVHGLRGGWTFKPDGDGTVIRWTYEFKPLRGRYFFVCRGLAPLWRRYMHEGVDAGARYAVQDQVV